MYLGHPLGKKREPFILAPQASITEAIFTFIHKTFPQKICLLEKKHKIGAQSVHIIPKDKKRVSMLEKSGLYLPPNGVLSAQLMKDSKYPIRL